MPLLQRKLGDAGREFGIDPISDSTNFQIICLEAFQALQPRSWTLRVRANFDLNSVLESLETGSDLVINLVSKKKMKKVCSCGVLGDTAYLQRLTVEEASAHYFSNLEDWSRSTYLANDI